MKKLPKYLTGLEIEQLLNSPRESKIRDRLILRLLYYGALRVSELAQLRIENINFKDSIILIELGKGQKDRMIPIDSRTLGLITDYKGPRKKGALIQSQKRKDISPRQIERIVKKYCRAIGIEDKRAHPHTLRHSFAVQGLKKGMNVRAIQKILGHSSLYTTQIYLDLTIEDLQADYKKLDIL